MDRIVQRFDEKSESSHREFWTVSLRTIITPLGTFSRDLDWDDYMGSGCSHYFLETKKGKWLRIRISQDNSRGDLFKNDVPEFRGKTDGWHTVGHWKFCA